MCGVLGVLKTQVDQGINFDAAYETYRGLLTLQHRGQDAAGILSFDNYQNKFFCHKELGLVAQVFNEKKLEKLYGNMAIGHTRYATTGHDGASDIQPLVTGFPLGIGFAHNGNIVNYKQLASEITTELGQQLLTTNDLEIFLNIFCNEVKQYKDLNFNSLKNAAKKVFDKVVGAYAVVGLLASHGLFGFRDPNGIRPLILGRKLCPDGVTYDYALSSESHTLQFLGHEIVRDIEPGEFIFINNEGLISSHVFREEKTIKAPCMFEWVYFASAESKLDEKSVYTARLDLGRMLAKKVGKLIKDKTINPDIVSPVPDTSRTSAISLAEDLQMPYREALIKNRYVQRSFILKGQEEREKAVELKLSPVRSEIEGKNILLVDDSIVRGTTSKRIINMLKRFGAKEVTLAITCPPLRYGCVYGIDFPNPNDLIAKNKTEEEMADVIGADKVIYIDEADLKTAIGKKELCMACLDNKYPTSNEFNEEFTKHRKELKEGK
jgi:amidophosphoribosyltransferase